MSASTKAFITGTIFMFIVLMIAARQYSAYLRTRVDVPETKRANSPVMVERKPQVITWKTYADPYYRFVLAYSTDAEIRMQPHRPPRGPDLVLPHDNKIETDGQFFPYMNIWITEKADPDLGQYVKDYVAVSQTDLIKLTYGTTSLNGIDAYRIHYDLGTRPSLTRMVFENSDHVFLFDYPDDQAATSTRMLAGLKFLQ